MCYLNPLKNYHVKKKQIHDWHPIYLNTKHITNTGQVTSTASWPVITPVAVVSLRDGDDGRLCVPTSSAHHAAQREHQQQTLHLVGQLTVA